MELVWHGMSSGETTGTIGPDGNRREEVASVENADLIRAIIDGLECKPEIILRVPCLFCNNGQALLLIPSTGQYECQICGRYGKLDSLAVLAADRFEYRHRRTVELMEADGVVKRERIIDATAKGERQHEAKASDVPAYRSRNICVPRYLPSHA